MGQCGLASGKANQAQVAGQDSVCTTTINPTFLPILTAFLPALSQPHSTHFLHYSAHPFPFQPPPPSCPRLLPPKGLFRSHWCCQRAPCGCFIVASTGRMHVLPIQSPIGLGCELCNSSIWRGERPQQFKRSYRILYYTACIGSMYSSALGY